jgi:hypothetical protein
MNARSIIVLEANEIPFKVFEYFCNRHPESSIARILSSGTQYSTYTEDKTRFIMPWTTWPSFHRGVNDEAHQIFKFGQWEIETDKRYPPIWSLLTRAGLKTGVFSSMQSAPLPENRADYAFYFPDMFSTDASTEPADLEVLQEFNLEMTRQSARNVSQRIAMGGAAKVLLNSRKLGVRAGTYADIGGQLLSEFANSDRKTRRRAYQPLILLDVFVRQLERTRPRFSTFFTNHVAAAMHRYWAAVFPEDYARFELDASWVKRFNNEIDFAMTKLDKIASKLVHFVDANPDYMLTIATSMGQGAIPATHVREFLTITNMPGFFASLGISPADVEERPAMVPDFSFKVAERVADDVEAALGTLVVAGKPVDFHRQNSFFHVSVYDERPGLTDAYLRDRKTTTAALGLGYMIHEDEVACTAQHVPQGSLIIYSPHAERRAQGGRGEISALDFAPSVLKHFGCEVPAYMRSADLLTGH